MDVLCKIPQCLNVGRRSTYFKWCSRAKDKQWLCPQPPAIVLCISGQDETERQQNPRLFSPFPGFSLRKPRCQTDFPWPPGKHCPRFLHQVEENRLSKLGHSSEPSPTETRSLPPVTPAHPSGLSRCHFFQKHCLNPKSLIPAVYSNPGTCQFVF